VGLPELVPIPRRALRHLSPQLAELYADTTERTLTRDLDELISRRLIDRTEAGYVPASYQVYSFMPSDHGF
jgi:DNA-binding HxlR family transcriptional regulator